MRDAFDEVGELARQALHSKTSEAVHAEGRERVQASAVASRFPGRAVRSKLGLVLAAAAALLLAVGLATYRRPLGYHVEGATSFDSNYLGAPADKPAEVRFDDGSLIRADPGTRLRIEESYADGARVLLERGTTVAHVTHARTTRWRFVAGPFAVHVTGTRFTLNWEPVTEEVELTLHEGSVELEGPLAAGRIAVRAGQRVRASLPKRSLHVESVSPPIAAQAAKSEPAPLAEPEPAPAENTAPVTPGPAPGPKPGTAQEDHRAAWPELVRQGRFPEVVEAARARGIEATLSSSNAGDLRALADAARYAGEAALAERALLMLRQRFAGSRDGVAAAFLIGRTKENARDLAAADRWYETYLAEARGGELAADALAGRMRVAGPLRGEAAARTLALEYLNRYPRGVHAGRAKKIVERE
ncbi:MAG TPA: FecR domain-containing protein [Polyangiaceae bacterium]